MGAALAEYSQEYEPWRLEDYDTRVIEKSTTPRKLALFGVAGDFSGDGVTDVALQGHDAGDELFFVILSEAAGAFRVIELRRRPRGTEKILSYLELVRPGQLHVPLSIASREPPPKAHHGRFRRGDRRTRRRPPLLEGRTLPRVRGGELIASPFSQCGPLIAAPQGAKFAEPAEPAEAAEGGPLTAPDHTVPFG
ncbi:MAG: hypothetical protein HY704_16980 [Gemmatimonadetes bacterium]|nr:hypothetical protein [Gemmatimonadota bacterium]